MSYKTLFIALFFPLVLSAQNFRSHNVWTFDVHFDFGTPSVQTVYLPKLDSLAVALVSDTNYHVVLQAHTDAVGSDISNKQLSERRSENIKNYLVSKNVDNQHIITENLGESQPIADNVSDNGRQNNRRVSVRLTRHIPMTTVSSVVKNDTGEVMVGAKVMAKSRFFRDSTTTDSAGFFKIDVPQNQEVTLDIIAKKHFYESRVLKIGAVPIKMIDVKLIKASIGRTMRIKSLHFYGGSPDLLPDSRPELLTIARFMELNDDYNIEIQGHINLPFKFPVGTESEDYILSVNRAKVVYDFLITHGISANRLSYKGFGNWEMIYPKAMTAGEQAVNRRVEIKVMDKK